LRRAGREANRRERKEARREQQVLELEGIFVIRFRECQSICSDNFSIWMLETPIYTSQNVHITTTTDLKLRILQSLRV
jgi:hypothetical protein